MVVSKTLQFNNTEYQRVYNTSVISLHLQKLSLSLIYSKIHYKIYDLVFKEDQYSGMGNSDRLRTLKPCPYVNGISHASSQIS